jgi:hypothetical protein
MAILAEQAFHSAKWGILNSLNGPNFGEGLFLEGNQGNSTDKMPKYKDLGKDRLPFEIESMPQKCVGFFYVQQHYDYYEPEWYFERSNVCFFLLNILNKFWGSHPKRPCSV